MLQEHKHDRNVQNLSIYFYFVSTRADSKCSNRKRKEKCIQNESVEKNAKRCLVPDNKIELKTISRIFWVLQKEFKQRF